MWRLMGIDEDGYPCEESNELTKADADKELARYQEFFPDTIYYIEPYEYTEPKEERHYNENAVDGWEDMYPDRD
jgi:hypothetical protein